MDKIERAKKTLKLASVIDSLKRKLTDLDTYGMSDLPVRKQTAEKIKTIRPTGSARTTRRSDL